MCAHLIFHVSRSNSTFVSLQILGFFSVECSSHCVPHSLWNDQRRERDINVFSPVLSTCFTRDIQRCPPSLPFLFLPLLSLSLSTCVSGSIVYIPDIPQVSMGHIHPFLCVCPRLTTKHLSRSSVVDFSNALWDACIFLLNLSPSSHYVFLCCRSRKQSNQKQSKPCLVEELFLYSENAADNETVRFFPSYSLV